jgi:superfamily II DNA or RNA helicase
MLRDYQQKCSDSVLEEFEERTSTLSVMPTGTGKTHVFADVVHRFQPKRALVLAHRDTLIMQARNKIEETTGLHCEVEMAELTASTNLFTRSPVVIATVQTLNAGQNGLGRMTRFNPNDFGLVICDEAHHFCAPSFRRVLDYFKQNPAIKIAGFTATPDRADEKALGEVFESVAFDYEILDAIHDGWLVNVEQLMVPIVGLDYSGIRDVAGDLNQGQLAAVMEEEETVQKMIMPTVEIAWGVPRHSLREIPANQWYDFLVANGRPRRSIVFCVSVAQAKRYAEILNRVHDGMAAVVWDKLKKERPKLLADFANGKTQIMCNVGIFGEGYDNAAIEIVFQAAATKSRCKYAQQAGRATRPLPGIVDGLPTAELRRAAIAASAKPICTLVDYVGNSGNHKLVSGVDILGGKASDEAIEMVRKEASKNGKVICISKAIDEAEQKLREEAEARKKAEAAKKAHLVAKSTYTTQKVNPFDVLELTPTKSRAWDVGKTLTEKQRQLLLRQDIDPTHMPYNEAKPLIDELFRRWKNKLCTWKQAKLLKRHKLRIDVTMEHAKEIIDALARNHWQRCAEVDAIAAKGQSKEPPGEVPF